MDNEAQAVSQWVIRPTPRRTAKLSDRKRRLTLGFRGKKDVVVKRLISGNSSLQLTEITDKYCVHDTDSIGVDEDPNQSCGWFYSGKTV